MACAEEIYKFALEQLAEQGNEQAKLALAMAKRLSVPPSRENQMVVITRELQCAEAALHRAIEANSTQWTSSTDRRINEALKYITSAIISAK